jgi:peptidoglycan/LPS O-acetylase OafA/YrhL
MASHVTEPLLLPADGVGSGVGIGAGNGAGNGLTVDGLGTGPGPSSGSRLRTGSARTGYLSMFDLFRIAACACVLGQHSLLWADMANNTVGTAFITILHFTRNSFFFLSGLVVCYAQITRPRTVWGFWVRRYVQMGVPYLAWTAIYVLFTILRPGGSWSQWHTYGWSDLRLGYYQLYVVVVLFQFYLVFPFLLKLLKSTSSRQHVLIMSISIAIALFIGTDLHYHPAIGAVGQYVHDIGSKWVWSRNLISYQMYFVAGMIVAFHFEAVFNFVRRWSRWILWGTAVVGVGTMLWYAIVLELGASTASASDIYEPIAVAWSLAVIAGLFALSVRWWERGPAVPASEREPVARRGLGRLRPPSITFLAGLTGGFYLCHVLFINMIRAALYSNFVGGEHLPWPIRSMIFYVGTAVVAATFVALILQTPLRWVLGGPVRAEQRVRDNAEFDALEAARERGVSMAGADAGASPPGAEEVLAP